MVAFLEGVIGGLQGSQNLRDAQSLREYRAADMALKQETADRVRNYESVSQASNLAFDLGIADAAGGAINVEKLTNLLGEASSTGKIDPKLSRLAALMGNEDFAAKNNPGFEFKGIGIGPDNTLTLVGGYEGEEGNKFVTNGRQKGDNAEVAFGDPQQVAGLIADQYNQLWNRPGVAPLKRELQLKGGILENQNSIDANNQTIYDAVGVLQNELENAIGQIGGEKAAQTITNLKVDVANLAPLEKLKVLQQYGSMLQIPTEQIITKEVQEAAQNVEAAGQADNSAEPEQSDMPAGTRNRLMKQLELAEKNLKKQQEIGDRGKLGGGMGYVEQAQARVDKLKAKLGLDQAEQQSDGNAPAPETVAKVQNATDEDIIEGKVKFTQEELESLQERLKAEGITKLEDMNKASRALQQEFRVALSTIAANTEQRATYLDRLNNVMSTGSTDYDAKELAEARVAQQTVDNAAYKAETGRITANRLVTEMFETFRGNQGTFIGKKVKKITDLFTDKDGEAQDVSAEDYKNAAIGPGGAISSLWGKVKEQKRILNSDASAMQKKTAQQQLNMLQQALLAQISFGMQFLSQDGDLEWSMATDSDAPLSGNDSALSRIARDGNGYIIVKPGSKDKDGDGFTETQFAEFLSDKELKKFFDEKLAEISSKRGY